MFRVASTHVSSKYAYSLCGHLWHSFMINTLSSAWPPLLSSAVFKLCQGVSAWFMEVWLGVILLQGEPANTSTSSSSKLWIITLSICQHQHLSAPQEEPVAHSSFIPVALSHLARTSGGPGTHWAPAIFTIQFENWNWMKQKQMSRHHYIMGKCRN